MTTPGTPHALDQEVAQRVAALRIRARRAVEGLRSGIHRSPHRGASVIFAEHREYRPGDDLRLLDWHAYARSDRHTIKRFEQETHLKAHLLLDVSASMDYDGGDPSTNKRAYAATLLAALALILLGQGDAVGAHLLDVTVRDSVPARARSDHLDALLRLFGREPSPGTGTDLASTLTATAERVGRRGLVVLASDLLDFDAHALSPLGRMHALGHDVLVFHVLHPDELEFPFEERTRFEDPEGEQALDVDPAVVRDAYRGELDAFLQSCRRRCIAAGARYFLARTDRPVQQVIAEALRSGSARPAWG